jgi:PIN domain nuclease of toxin-antitoxin system
MTLLLDTCAAIWISENAALADSAVEALDRAEDDGEPILLSPITAWEIGLLVAAGRLALPTSPEAWLNRLMQAPPLRLADLTTSVLIASSFLPGQPPRDPADKIIIATARAQNLTVVTRDRHILAYGKAGHVLALAC